MMSLSEILSFGAFIVSVLAGVIALSKRKSEVAVNEADEADKISAAWERLNKPTMERIAALEDELRATKHALSTALGRINELERENEELRRGKKPGRGFATA